MEEPLEPTAPVQDDTDLGIDPKAGKQPQLQEPLEPTAPVKDDVAVETSFDRLEDMKKPAQDEVEIYRNDSHVTMPLTKFGLYFRF